MNNNQYPVNGTDNKDTMNKNFHGNWKSQGINSHNRLNEIQDTEQTATEIKDDVILVIAEFITVTV